MTAKARTTKAAPKSATPKSAGTATRARRSASKASAQTAVSPEAPAVADAAGQTVVAAAKPRRAGALIIPFASALNLNALKSKDNIMATAFETAQETVRNSVNKLNAQAETAISNGKAAMEQVTAKSKEAVEAGMKTLDELTELNRGHVEALIASAKAATAGVEQVVSHLTEVSKKSFEDTQTMVKTLAAAKSPNEFMQLQSDYAKAQFDEAVAQYSKLTEMMVKLAGEVMEPVQNQIAVTADKLKSAITK